MESSQERGSRDEHRSPTHMLFKSLVRGNQSELNWLKARVALKGKHAKKRDFTKRLVSERRRRKGLDQGSISDKYESCRATLGTPKNKNIK